MEQVNFSQFVKLPALMKTSETENTYFKSDIYINPLNVYYYHAAFFSSDGVNQKEIVVLCVAGRLFNIDMTMEEFLDIWYNVNRGFEINL